MVNSPIGWVMVNVTGYKVVAPEKILVAILYHLEGHWILRGHSSPPSTKNDQFGRDMNHDQPALTIIVQLTSTIISHH